MKQYIYSYFRKIKKRLLSKLSALNKEQRLISFFVFLFFLIFARLFSLQIVYGETYTQKLIDQHYTKSSLEAERGHLYVTDKSWEDIQLTENVDLFTLFVDPKFVWDKETLIADIVPVLYDHFCVLHELEEPTKIECLEHFQSFMKEQYLPTKPQLFYTTWSVVWVEDNQIVLWDITWNIPYTQQLEETIDFYNPDIIKDNISKKMDELIQQWYRSKNYIWYFINPKDISVFEDIWLKSVEVTDWYVYLVPAQVWNISSEAKLISKAFNELSDFEPISEEVLESRYLVPQENRYVKIASWLNVKYVDRIQKTKEIYRKNRLAEEWVWSDLEYPLFHGVWLESYQKRYYPQGSFMSHVLWYLDRNGEAYYGVEEYFDEQLSGKQWRIVWLATPWVGQVGSNNVVIEQPEDGIDVYLTLDPTVQKELESRVRQYTWFFRADSISVVIIDPETWKIAAMANSPDFDPNDYVAAYDMEPLSEEYKYLIEDETRVDIPLFTLSGSNLKQATSEERLDLTLEKYFFKNFLWPQVFVDKNISFPYEPGSIFKALTLGIAIDSDSLSMYDFYYDPGSVKIGIYEIANIARSCTGTHTYLHALAYSCNVGMVRIAQKVYKYVFYDYLAKLWFGEKTGIELWQEDGGTLPDFNVVSMARYFNNTYGQWLLATPLQMAVSYSALLNGGRHISPTVVESIYDPWKERFLDIADSSKTKIFKTKTSLDMKDALVNVIDNWGLIEIKKPGYSLAWKTWTSEISYKWEYKWWRWWTNGSFVWAVTAKETKYVVAIQVRRPRSSERWLDTAWRLFSEIAEFLLWYEQIEE